ncbi:Ulp1 protease family, C-terminal catalytic domain containing protein [Parasponia andersonii]|uniref:Ulp1 protease family, C-terminal catalytic domain containing protein n=1 Tax=Parasponia andersonii TaxID=3476 RepID=A0A2P5BPT5_PARAD|nr:Ulp1 protease family, C-terminal catalytic domain containing protein [Parasponia andersonii]
MMDCIDVFKIKKLVTKALLNPRETEKEFYEHIYHDLQQSLGSTGVEEEGIDGEEEEENKKEVAEAKRAAEEAGIFDAPRNKVEEEPSTDVPQSYKFYLELKTDIAELKANQIELKANQVILNDKLDRLLKMMEEIKVHRQSTGSESEATQSDVLPEGYQPGEDVIISTPTKEHTPEEQQTPGVKKLQVAEVATVKFGRKKQVDQRSKRLIDYTDPSNKKFKTYRKKVTLADTVYIACMNGRWDAFQRTSNKAKFLWDDQLTDYVKRDAYHFQHGWAEVDEVYYPLNIGSNHWVLVQIDLPVHMLTMLPYFLLNVEGVTNRDDLDLTRMTKPRDFDVRRLPPNVVSQTAKSGDCGVFVVKHLECLLADIPLSNVVDDIM